MSEIPPPIGVPNNTETGVHLQYIRRDVDELKILQTRQHTEVMQRLEEMMASYPNRSEFKELQEKVEDHETRVRSIEKSIWKWTGIAVAISTTATFLFQILTSK